jgi:hypothetical protein
MDYYLNIEWCLYFVLHQMENWEETKRRRTFLEMLTGCIRVLVYKATASTFFFFVLFKEVNHIHFIQVLLADFYSNELHGCFFNQVTKI